MAYRRALQHSRQEKLGNGRIRRRKNDYETKETLVKTTTITAADASILLAFLHVVTDQRERTNKRNETNAQPNENRRDDGL